MNLTELKVAVENSPRNGCGRIIPENVKLEIVNQWRKAKAEKKGGKFLSFLNIYGDLVHAWEEKFYGGEEYTQTIVRKTKGSGESPVARTILERLRKPTEPTTVDKIKSRITELNTEAKELNGMLKRLEELGIK